MRISMTWPQYLRRQVRLVGKNFDAVITLSPREAEMVCLMLMRRDHPITDDEFIEYLWPNPDEEPDWAATSIGIYVSRLRKKLPGVIENRHSFGYLIPRSIGELTAFAPSTIMPAVETTTEQETNHNGREEQEVGFGVQDHAQAGARHQEHLRLQEPGRRRAHPFALYRQERLLRRCAEVDHRDGRRGLTASERRRLKRRVTLLLRIYPHLRARS